jgi:hypothetical protein
VGAENVIRSSIWTFDGEAMMTNNFRSCLADPQVRTMVARGMSRGEVSNKMHKVHQGVVDVVSDSVECAPQKKERTAAGQAN